MKSIYYNILLKVSLGISVLFALNCSPISSEIFLKFHPHKIFFTQLNPLVRGHLDKVEEEQQRIKQKKFSILSGNSGIKKMVFERFYEHLPHFQFKEDFYSYCRSQCPDFALSPHKIKLLKTKRR